jgi:hypothetical protein
VHTRKAKESLPTNSAITSQRIFSSKTKVAFIYTNIPSVWLFFVFFYGKEVYGDFVFAVQQFQKFKLNIEHDVFFHSLGFPELSDKVCPYEGTLHSSTTTWQKRRKPICSRHLMIDDDP